MVGAIDEAEFGLAVGGPVHTGAENCEFLAWQDVINSQIADGTIEKIAGIERGVARVFRVQAALENGLLLSSNTGRFRIGDSRMIQE